jgi:hypothetical protein
LGDALVVLLLYCFVKTFFNLSPLQVTISVLLFSYFIEAFQYLNGAEWLGLSHYPIAVILLGNSFSWLDMLAYTCGAVFILIVERKRIESNNVTVK